MRRSRFLSDRWENRVASRFGLFTCQNIVTGLIPANSPAGVMEHLPRGLPPPPPDLPNTRCWQAVNAASQVLDTLRPPRTWSAAQVAGAGGGQDSERPDQAFPFAWSDILSRWRLHGVGTVRVRCGSGVGPVLLHKRMSMCRGGAGVGWPFLGDYSGVEGVDPWRILMPPANIQEQVGVPEQGGQKEAAKQGKDEGRTMNAKRGLRPPQS